MLFQNKLSNTVFAAAVICGMLDRTSLIGAVHLRTRLGLGVIGNIHLPGTDQFTSVGVDDPELEIEEEGPRFAGLTYGKPVTLDAEIAYHEEDDLAKSYAKLSGTPPPLSLGVTVDDPELEYEKEGPRFEGFAKFDGSLATDLDKETAFYEREARAESEAKLTGAWPLIIGEPVYVPELDYMDEGPRYVGLATFDGIPVEVSDNIDLDSDRSAPPSPVTKATASWSSPKPEGWTYEELDSKLKESQLYNAGGEPDTTAWELHFDEPPYFPGMFTEFDQNGNFVRNREKDGNVWEWEPVPPQIATVESPTSPAPSRGGPEPSVCSPVSAATASTSIRSSPEPMATGYWSARSSTSSVVASPISSSPVLTSTPPSRKEVASWLELKPAASGAKARQSLRAEPSTSKTNRPSRVDVVNQQQ